MNDPSIETKRKPQSRKFFAGKLTPVAKSSYIALAVTGILMVILLTADFHYSNYSTYNTSTMSYLRGVVTKITSQTEMETSGFSGLDNGTQELLVKVADGRTLAVENVVSDTHHVMAEEGMHVIVCADEPENAEPYYTLFNYDRTVPIAVFLMIFAALILLIGGVKGLFSLAALAFSVVFIFRVMIPEIYSGTSAIAAALVTALVITAVSVSLFTGFTVKSLVSGVVTFGGALCAAGFFAVFSSALRINGLVDENVDSLLVVAQNTGLDLKNLLYAAAIIASLGAVMDVAVSLVAAIWEIYERNRELTRWDLFVSGMTVGRDMMGTMSNTLILAFVGTALSMILVLYSYGVQPVQLLNSNYVSAELAHGLCGTMAVIITVPIAAAASAMVLPSVSAEKVHGGG